MYLHVYREEILPSANTLLLCVTYGPQNKKVIFPYTASTYWILSRKRNVFIAR